MNPEAHEQGAAAVQAVGGEPAPALAEAGGPASLGPRRRRRLAARARGGRKRLVIHAGIHRTGSTAVQSMLSKTRRDLHAQGVAYPEDFVGARTAYERQMNHTGLAWAILEREVTGKQLLEWLAAAAPPSCKTVILSAEDFCMLQDVGFLADLRSVWDVQAVFYLRRQDHWLNSWYNQNVRWPFDAELSSATPTEFLDHLDQFHWLQYFDLLERWADVLGRESLHVRVLEKGQVEDAAKDLLSILGVETRSQAIRANESISADKLHLLRRLGFIRFGYRQRMAVLDALESIPSDRTANVYDSSLRRRLVQRFEPQNLSVAREYLGRPDGPLFLDDSYPPDDTASELAPALDEALALKLIEALAQPRG